MNEASKKFISPGAWFSMYYPAKWSEFEDTEGSFLFYNPDRWSGNFRISAFKKDIQLPNARRYARQMVDDELRSNPSASLVRIGDLQCAYSKEMFQEEGTFYTNHLWVSGIENVVFHCSFTVPKGGSVQEAEDVISTLEIREDGKKYPAEIIPVRVSEISMVDEGFEVTADMVKRLFKKDFQGAEDDLPNIQKVIESGQIKPKQKDYWLAFGITVCVILANEIEGMEWMTLIDGNREAPVLQYTPTGMIIDPMRMVWSKIKAGEPCDVVQEYKSVIENI